MRSSNIPIIFITLLLATSASPAEEELTVLLFEANLIGKIDSVDSSNDPEDLINVYYKLLSGDVLEEIAEHKKELDSLIPRYKIAYTAADSAELAELMDEISRHLGILRDIHARYFNSEVQTLLDQAYDARFMQVLKP